MIKKRSRLRGGVVLALLTLVLLLPSAGSLVHGSEGIDCGEALSRCLNDQSWWERLLNPDYCLVGFLFCLFYMQ